ncbi:MAG: hypothetical protein AAF494_00645 [Pseudomonadota bacterium]
MERRELDNLVQQISDDFNAQIRAIDGLIANQTAQIERLKQFMTVTNCDDEQSTQALAVMQTSLSQTQAARQALMRSWASARQTGTKMGVPWVCPEDDNQRLAQRSMTKRAA